MNISEIKTKLEALKNKIRHHEFLYYSKSMSEISDQEFDYLMKELQEIEDSNPELITKDSPTQRVGGTVTSFASLKHRIPMMSIENSYSISDVQSWINRIEKTLGHSVFPIIAELKIDGVSTSLHYDNGFFQEGVTRGNGKEGDVITSNLKAIKTVPLGIESKLDMDIRGEIYTPKSKLLSINETRQETGLEPFKNCRNLTSGTIKSLNSQVVGDRGLQVMVYGIAQAGELGFKHHSEALNFLEKQGFNLNKQVKKCNSIEEVEAFITIIDGQKTSLDFDIDGIVLKVDNLESQIALGETSKAPRWLMAYKYPQEQAITKLKAVTWQVGRSQLTPVAEMEPVELGGTTVSRASLHNIDQIREKDIRVGDKIRVEKAGYIIPYVVESLHSERTGNELVITPPEYCPECKVKLLIADSEADTDTTRIYCNNIECPGVLSKKIIYSVSQLEIDNLGPQLIEKLIKMGLANSLNQVLSLSIEDLISVDRMGAKSANKIFENIQKAKKVTLAKLISSLGIPNVGAVVGEKIAAYFHDDFAKFLLSSREELMEIEGISNIVADNILSFRDEEINLLDIDFLKQWWQGPDIRDIETVKNTFENKSFVLTGEALVSRKILSTLIKAHSGTTKPSVSAKIDYLLIGSNEPENFISSKKTKAKQLNIPIISEKELFVMAGVTLEDVKKIGKN